jgi:putative sigma-54 modulation protein
MNNHELIISGRHLELTESLKTFVREKTEKLFQHEARIVRIRVELDVEKVHAKTKDFLFTAKGIIEIMGPDMVVSESSDEMHKSIDLLVNKLDRMIRRRARLAKVKRNHPHAVEIPAFLPKTAPA